jgi:hypothetical protein
MEPVRIIQTAKRKGLGGVAVVDHNTIRGGLECLKANPDKEFVVVIGSEIETEHGDVLGLFLTEEVRSRNAEAVIEEVKEQGGIAVLPHPFKREAISRDLLVKFDAIEVFNARYWSWEYVKKALQTAADYRLPTTAGSDAHFYFEIGRGRCMAENAFTEEDVRRAILSGETSVEGSLTCPYVEMLSQINKAFKQRKPKLLFSNVAVGTAYLTYLIVSNKLGDGADG